MTRFRKAQAPKSGHNRIAAVMLHLPRYWEFGQQTLARDANVSVSALSRLMRGEAGHSQFWLVAQVATALEKELGRPIDPRDLVSKDGEYPTRFVCSLVGCSGCLPKHAYDKENNLVAAYRGVPRGCWTGDIHEPKEKKCREVKEVND